MSQADELRVSQFPSAQVLAAAQSEFCMGLEHRNNCCKIARQICQESLSSPSQFPRFLVGSPYKSLDLFSYWGVRYINISQPERNVEKIANLKIGDLPQFEPVDVTAREVARPVTTGPGISQLPTHCTTAHFPGFGRISESSTGFHIGLSPLPGCQWQMKVYRDPLLKNKIILVVTVPGQGDNPTFT